MSVSDESHIIFTYYRVSNPTGPHQIWNWKYENSEGQIRSGSCELCKSSHRDSSWSLRLLASGLIVRQLLTRCYLVCNEGDSVAALMSSHSVSQKKL